MKSIPSYIKFLLQIAIFSLLLMTFFRLFLYFKISSGLEDGISNSSNDIFGAFKMGLRYDNLVTSYLLMPVFIVIGIASFFTSNLRQLYRWSTFYFILAFSLVFLAFCTDIPYFIQFNSRLNSGALLWMDDSKYMLGMIFTDWVFISYFILFVLLSVFGTRYLLKVSKKYQGHLYVDPLRKNWKGIISRLAVFIIFAGLLIISARGRLSAKSPMRIGTAFFCNNQTLNKIAENPVFTFSYTVLDDRQSKNKVELMDPLEAEKISAQYLSVANDDSSSLAYLQKWQKTQNSAQPMNVVFIIMESMGTYKMGHFDGPKNLTPELNKLVAKSLYFDQIYTAGIHTFNGIYSTLFSYPALYRQQPLEQFMDINHEGIAEVLQSEGYSTAYFSTHDPHFDNVSGFLKANAFEHIFSDYPSDWKQTANGVPDHKMFDHAIPQLTELSENKAPFFAAFMTASDHRPHYIPEDINFKAKSDQIETQITEYADWSIGHFFEEASKEDWFENTLFVLIGDHGLSMGHTYDMPLSYHHTPLLFYVPGQEDLKDTMHMLGGQIDVAPTVLGMLNIPYENKTMGVDLFSTKRPFMYFCADDKIGCLDQEYYLIIRPENNETLYRYSNLETTNYLDQYQAKVDSMKKYTFSMMQSTQSKMIIKPELTKKLSQ